MRIYIIISTLIFSNLIFSQDISGNWNWNYSEKHSSEISLEQVNSNEYKGNYCSSYYNGTKIDCNKDENDYCLFLSKVSDNIYEGTFESSFSKSIGTIRIEYIVSSDKIKILILSEPEGEFYLPNDVFFEK